MLNDEAGRYFRDDGPSGFRTRGESLGEAPCILIVDPILGSRFTLAQAVSRSRYRVETASTIEDAITCLDRGRVSLVIAEENLGDRDGLAFLREIRGRYPETHRALVTTKRGEGFVRSAIDQAGLSFLLTKPWNPDSLRQSVREVIEGEVEFAGWRREFSKRIPEKNSHWTAGPVPADNAAGDETVLRGLLAGLNSCESEVEIFDLIHSETRGPFHISRWTWIDDEEALVARVAQDGTIVEGLGLRHLTHDEWQCLADSRTSRQVMRVGGVTTSRDPRTYRDVCIGLPIRIERNGTRCSLDCLVWLERVCALRFLVVLRELQGALEMTFLRIRQAKARADAARRLATRVSEQLRSPVGALTHAVDQLRGEAERAGLPSEWVDRVSSESQRVARVVEHLQDEMLSGSSTSISTSN